MADFVNLDQTSLNKALTEVEALLGPLLVKAKTDAEKLVKHGEGSPEGTPPSEETPGSASAEGSASGSGASAPAPDAGGSAPAPSPSPAPPDASAAPADPAADAGPVDPQMLVAEYAKLPPDQLAMHQAALQEALKMVGGGDGSAAAPMAPLPAAPPAAPPMDAGSAPAPAPLSPSPAGPPMGKAEVSKMDPTGSAPMMTTKSETPAAKKGPMSGPANGENPLDAVKKAEQRISELEAKLAKSTQEMDSLRKASEEKLTALNKVAELLTQPKPLRKAYTGVSQVVSKPGEGASSSPAVNLSKAEIKVKLGQIDRTKLSKAERDAINHYCLSDEGATDLSAIEKFLK